MYAFLLIPLSVFVSVLVKDARRSTAVTREDDPWADEA